jgi:hypothetical protein
MAFSPGSKGWISKYGDMLRKGEITIRIEKPSELQKDHFQHLFLSKSGIVFGYATELLFTESYAHEKWTNEERLKLLLFESHLFIFVSNGGNPIEEFDRFTQSLLDFYGYHGSKSLLKKLTFFLKESKTEKLENILDKRTDVRLNLLENAIWVNYLSNSFVYLDVILFEQFIQTNQVMVESQYEEYAYNALIALTLSAYSDGQIEEKEKNIFNVFLASAHFDDERKELAIKKFKEGAHFEDFSQDLIQSWLFKRFLLDISALTIFATHEVSSVEKVFLKSLCAYLAIPAIELEEALVMMEHFILNHNDQITFLQDNNVYEKMYGSISKRWIKILGRNKDKLAAELKESKELVFLIKKSTTQELSKEEKEKVKTQFLDLAKSMPALAIFLLPGGALLLPFVLKIIPSLVPSAFRNNEIES